MPTSVCSTIRRGPARRTCAGAGGPQSPPRRRTCGFAAIIPMSDGLTAYLRRRFPADAYVGIEIEINQKQVLRNGRNWRARHGTVTRALQQAVAGIPGG